MADSLITAEVRADLIERQAARIGTEEGLGQLHEQLAAYVEMFGASPANRDQASWRSILAVTQFLQDVGVPFEVLLPLMHAAEALEHKAKPGRPPKPGLAKVSDGMLAVIAELAVRSFRSKGTRPYEAPALDEARKRLKSEWGVTVSSSRLKELRNAVNAASGRRAGGLQTTVWDVVSKSRGATEEPGRFLNSLLKNKRAALYYFSE